MEQDFFDISQYKWILIVVVAIAYKLLSLKPRVDEQQEDEASIEEFLEAGMMTQEREKKPTPSGTDRVARAQHLQNRIASKDKISGGEIGAKSETQEESIAEDFDLQKAVIMSEILNRKYE